MIHGTIHPFGGYEKDERGRYFIPNLNTYTMNYYSTRGMAAELATYETPFADEVQETEQEQERGQSGPQNYSDNYLTDLESPFSQNFSTTISEKASTPLASNYVQLLASLNDREFTETLYEMASELQDSWISKISNETAMGERFVPFATQRPPWASALFRLPPSRPSNTLRH